MMDASGQQRIRDLLACGWRFADLHASADGGELRTLLVDDGGATHLERRVIEHGSCGSIVGLSPAAAWDEREVADLTGVRFVGHEPLRPLLDHSAPLERWTVAVKGRDAYQVAVGPIHAGVIESGHFRFHVVGDRVLLVDVRLFYKRRGLELAAEGQTLEGGLAYVRRACAGCSVANSVAYVHACEELLGFTPAPELSRARTVLIELERVWNHLNDIAAVCAGVGLAAGNNRFSGLVERARRLNAAISGHRLLFETVEIGKSALSLSQAQAAAARGELADVNKEAASAWRELLFNRSFQDRLDGVGRVSTAAASELGVTGPAARASGIGRDLRSASPGLAYPKQFAPVLGSDPGGDVRARLEQRALELGQSFELLDELLAGALSPVPARAPEAAIGPARQHAAPARGEIGVGRVESARGETTCLVEHLDGRIARLRLRTASYANWPAVAHAASGNLLPDFPLINKSFELCYACVDR